MTRAQRGNKEGLCFLFTYCRSYPLVHRKHGNLETNMNRGTPAGVAYLPVFSCVLSGVRPA